MSVETYPASKVRDKQYLDMAARAAMRAMGDVEPNPMVGAVMVGVQVSQTSLVT